VHAQPDPTEALRGAGFRVTPQRHAILRAFEGGRSEHLTADEVFERVRATLPTVSRATVYGTLADFARGGLLASVGRPEAVTYESNVEGHDHFRCDHCGRRFDIEHSRAADAAAQGPRKALTADGFVVERSLLTLEGTCGPCARFEHGLRAAVAARHHRPAATALTALLERLGDVAVGAVDTPVGRLHVAASSEGVIRVVFPEQADHHVLEPLTRERQGARAAARVRATAIREIGEYFSDGRRSFDAPLDWRAVEERHREVLHRTELVPYGTTRAYHHLAHNGDSPEPARVVGSALGANPLPIFVPCHRVGRAPDDPVDYTGGLERKRALQAIEAAHTAK
jgi:methylated-DNA-[protein]-cysteine S-methyltransferase